MSDHEWICTDDDKNIWQCTYCGEEFIIEAGTPSDNEWWFCAHCGADMQLTASNEKKHTTYIEDFFEKFPNAKKDGRGLPLMCRSSVYGGSCHFGTAERADCAACWNAEMEDAYE